MCKPPTYKLTSHRVEALSTYSSKLEILQNFTCPFIWDNLVLYLSSFGRLFLKPKISDFMLKILGFALFSSDLGNNLATVVE